MIYISDHFICYSTAEICLQIYNFQIRLLKYINMQSKPIPCINKDQYVVKKLYFFLFICSYNFSLPFQTDDTERKC